MPQRAKRRTGLMRDAGALGVTYQHLSAVLNKHRKSKSLLERYNQLQREKQRAVAA
jgi:hypothetical protein